MKDMKRKICLLKINYTIYYTHFSHLQTLSKDSMSEAKLTSSLNYQLVWHWKSPPPKELSSSSQGPGQEPAAGCRMQLAKVSPRTSTQRDAQKSSFLLKSIFSAARSDAKNKEGKIARSKKTRLLAFSGLFY